MISWLLGPIGPGMCPPRKAPPPSHIHHYPYISKTDDAQGEVRHFFSASSPPTRAHCCTQWERNEIIRIFSLKNLQDDAQETEPARCRVRDCSVPPATHAELMKLETWLRSHHPVWELTKHQMVWATGNPANPWSTGLVWEHSWAGVSWREAGGLGLLQHLLGNAERSDQFQGQGELWACTPAVSGEVPRMLVLCPEGAWSLSCVSGLVSTSCICLRRVK